MGWTRLLTESLVNYTEDYIFSSMEVLDEFGDTKVIKPYLKYVGKSKTPEQPKGIKTYRHMFYNCDIDLDLSDWDMSEAEDLEGMFENANNLNLFSLKDWNTSNVLDMSRMFGGIGKSDSTALNLSFIKDWDVSKVIIFDDMFYGSCFINLDQLDNWNVNDKATFKNMFIMRSRYYPKPFKSKKIN